MRFPLEVFEDITCLCLLRANVKLWHISNIAFLFDAWSQVVAHLEDDTVGGLETLVTRMLEADPNFRKYLMNLFLIVSNVTLQLKVFTAAVFCAYIFKYVTLVHVVSSTVLS